MITRIKKMVTATCIWLLLFLFSSGIMINYLINVGGFELKQLLTVGALHIISFITYARFYYCFQKINK